MIEFTLPGEYITVIECCEKYIGPKKYKPVIVNDVEYPSIKHAIESLGIKHRATFYDKVKRGIIKLDYK